MAASSLIDFPDQFETDRLLIRAPRPGDGVAIDEAVRETLVALRRWMDWALPEPSVEISEAFARRGAADFAARIDLPMLLWLKGGQTFVGSSGLHPHDWMVPRFEIGYWCRARFEGQGYISEAVRGISHFAFERLSARRLEIWCDACNERSARVAERTGFQLEGRLRNHMLDTRGHLRDTLVFACLSSDELRDAPAAKGRGQS
ncbi:MAG TPA: GNAT family protein [Nitrolancea sp.]|jgi:RimJ/RimL family protein N-acetyltransferase|nr:GNAT family protein [Nitrolancea sp.]